MIKQLELENFKGITKFKPLLGKITIFIGPNGTGKSSCAHALMALKQSVGNTQLVLKGALIDLGDFVDVLNKGSSSESIGLGLTVELGDYPSWNIRDGVTCRYHALFNPGVVECSMLIESQGKSCFEIKVEEGSQISVSPQVKTWQFDQAPVQISFNYSNVILNPISMTTGHDARVEKEWKEIYSNTRALIESVLTAVKNTYYVPPMRGFERPEYLLENESRIDVGSGQNSALASTYAYAGKNIEKMVSSWSESITGSPVLPRVVPGRLVRIESGQEGIPVIGDGFGTNQLIQLLLTLAITPKGSLIAIDEPEIHLHPQAQVRLCKVLLEVVLNQDKQLIITTHSAQVLYKFLNALKDGQLTHDQLKIYYFEQKNQPPTLVTPDEGGDIYDWGRYFFAVPDEK